MRMLSFAKSPLKLFESHMAAQGGNKGLDTAN